MVFKPETKLTFGKYKGEKAGDVAEEDSSYISWASNNIEWFECSDELKKIYKEHKPKGRRRYLSPPGEGRNAVEQGYLDVFGHTGPNGGWGNQMAMD